jgi:cation diffusion facilitator family transporter
MGFHHEHVFEKKQVALTSVGAAFFLTGSKVAVGLLTGSLGILSEALHSLIDLVAAVITYFSVRLSDEPADSDHQYGHGKIENVSALVQTVLLLVTCVWIIYEAVHRLRTGKMEIEVNVWSYLVIIISIIVDYSRSRALKKTAIKYNSQALEADALHFSTDIWSSAVVLLGLICVQFGWFAADSIAALLVAVIVLIVSYQLGKRSIDVLLDKAPKEFKEYAETIETIAKETPEIGSVHDIKIRNAGPQIFVELTVHLPPSLTIEEAHKISHELEKKIHEKIPRCKIHLHEEPEEDLNKI